jgi:hypothetical protein
VTTRGKKLLRFEISATSLPGVLSSKGYLPVRSSSSAMRLGQASLHAAGEFRVCCPKTPPHHNDDVATATAVRDESRIAIIIDVYNDGIVDEDDDDNHDDAVVASQVAVRSRPPRDQPGTSQAPNARFATRSIQ